LSTNPYESPCPVAAARPSFNWHRAAVRAALLLPVAYPLSVLASLYTSWLIAWGVLGHAPRPFIDDPSGISPAVNAACLITGLLIVALPAGVAGSIGAYVMQAIHWKWPTRIAGALLIMGVWSAAFCLLRLDPLRVAGWFMD